MPARTFTRQELAALVLETWQRALKNSSLTLDEDFFSAGGDSLLVDEVTVQLSAATGIEIPIVTLFVSPTAAEFTDALLELTGGSGASHG